MLKTNYHTHTYRCKHCMGNDERMVQTAIEAGTDIMGFSDHNPWPFYPQDFDSRVRMEPEYFAEYCASVHRLQKKYASEIELHLGIEAEYYPHHMDCLKELVESSQIEYVILGNHFPEPKYGESPESFYFGRNCVLPDHLEEYCESTIKGIESGYYCYVAHPDLFMRCYPVFDEKCAAISQRICAAAAKHNALLEYNLSGFWYAREHHLESCFPYPDFWKIAADYHIRAIIGYDAHNFEVLKDRERYSEAIRFLHDLGIERIEKLEL